MGEMSGLTSLMGASAPPSHAPAANPQKMPKACRLRRRVACMVAGLPGVGSDSRIVSFMSAESIQKQKSADEYREGNPEMDVGGDHAEQVAGDRRGDREFRQWSNLFELEICVGLSS